MFLMSKIKKYLREKKHYDTKTFRLNAETVEAAQECANDWGQSLNAFVEAAIQMAVDDYKKVEN